MPTRPPMHRPVAREPRKPWAERRYAGARQSGRALQETRKRIMVRDDYRCADCGRFALDHDVDHVVPLSAGGRDDDTNRQLLCRGRGRCHDRKSRADRTAERN
ncbi:HNH endonuclease [Dokdonella sp. MW10]|uniref:HNH endonuclease n=1 Tax=Dokdonella sp. MW10 TaxID=2992926 RepID=UPI003F802AB3